MPLDKKAPLRQLSGQEPQKLTQICRPQVTAAVEVIREDPPSRRPRFRLLNRLITRPRCNDRGHPAFTFGLIDRSPSGVPDRSVQVRGV
jgi:hypothetical protein